MCFTNHKNRKVSSPGDLAFKLHDAGIKVQNGAINRYVVVERNGLQYNLALESGNSPDREKYVNIMVLFEPDGFSDDDTQLNNQVAVHVTRKFRLLRCIPVENGFELGRTIRIERNTQEFKIMLEKALDYVYDAWGTAVTAYSTLSGHLP